MWGTLAVLTDRDAWNTASPAVLSDDNTWGFGQVLPMMLLILPFVSFFEVAYGERYRILIVLSLQLV